MDTEDAEITEEMNAMYNRNAKDPLARQRGICLAADCKTRKHYMILRECNNRVRSKDYTMENCQEEMIDLVEALNHCVGGKAFRKLV